MSIILARNLCLNYFKFSVFLNSAKLHISFYENLSLRLPAEELRGLGQVETLTDKVVVQRHDKLLLHVVQHEVHELLKVDRLVALFVNLAEKLLYIPLGRLLVDTSFREVHLEKIFDLITLKHAIVILVEGVKCYAHLLNTLPADGLWMRIHLHHAFVLADQILHVVLAEVHLSLFNY